MKKKLFLFLNFIILSFFILGKPCLASIYDANLKGFTFEGGVWSTTALIHASETNDNNITYQKGGKTRLAGVFSAWYGIYSSYDKGSDSMYYVLCSELVVTPNAADNTKNRHGRMHEINVDTEISNNESLAYYMSHSPKNSVNGKWSETSGWTFSGGISGGSNGGGEFNVGYTSSSTHEYKEVESTSTLLNNKHKLAVRYYFPKYDNNSYNSAPCYTGTSNHISSIAFKVPNYNLNRGKRVTAKFYYYANIFVDDFWMENYDATNSMSKECVFIL